jgi:hypothetical protein
VLLRPNRPLLDNAAHHPAGYDFSKLQAALLVFSTQVRGGWAAAQSCAGRPARAQHSALRARA